MIEVVAALGGAASLVFGVWALVVTVRNGGLREDNTRLRADNDRLDGALETQLAEYLDYKRRAKQRIEHLMDELEALEDKQHAEIAKIEDPVKRRRRRRAFVADLLNDGVLPEEATSAGSADDNSVSGESTTDSTEED
jgi:hypothetical protein